MGGGYIYIVHAGEAVLLYLTCRCLLHSKERGNAYMCAKPVIPKLKTAETNEYVCLKILARPSCRPCLVGTALCNTHTWIEMANSYNHNL